MSDPSAAIAAISNLSLAQNQQAVASDANHSSSSTNVTNSASKQSQPEANSVIGGAVQQSPIQISHQESNSNTPIIDQNSSQHKEIPMDSQLTLRALITSGQGGVVIGRGGNNIAELRESTGCKAGVSKVIPGVPDRVLTVNGPLEGVAKAYASISQTILSNPMNDNNMVPQQQAIGSIRFLISHNLMGSLIGRGGNRIKQIQDSSGVRMVASKEMLPQSTERVVEVQGSPEAIRSATLEIGKCLLEDWERGVGTMLYTPAGQSDTISPLPNSTLGSSLLSAPSAAPLRRASAGGYPALVSSTGLPSMQQRRASVQAESAYTSSLRQTPASPPLPSVDPSLIKTQNISIPSDMVGCIIGRGGSKITEIRRLSKSKISIAKVPHDETGERLFSIVGTAECNEMALFLLYNQLETEKVRRIREAEDQ